MSLVKMYIDNILSTESRNDLSNEQQHVLRLVGSFQSEYSVLRLIKIVATPEELSSLQIRDSNFQRKLIQLIALQSKKDFLCQSVFFLTGLYLYYPLLLLGVLWHS